MKVSQFLFAVVVAVLCLSCSKDIIETTGNFGGIVVDRRTNEPLSGVGVTLSPIGKSVTTGSDGRYEYRDIPAGDYTVQAVKANYQMEKKTISVSPGDNSSLDFQLTPSTANLVVSKSTFDFGNEATTLSLDISNDGYAVLDWYISEDIPWLSFIPASGRVQPGEKSSVVLNVDRSGLSQGNYSGTFSVSSNGGSRDILVNMSVQGITVQVSPEQLDFGATTTVLTVSLKNTASATASYTLATSNAWIKLQKKSGVLSSSASEAITISVDRTGMSEGDYNGNVVLSVGEHKKDIPVRMNIPAKAKPQVYLNAVTDITSSEAVFKGSVVSIGSSNVLHHGFCWSTTTEPTIEDGEMCNFGDCNAAKEFTHKVITLEQLTTYYVRAYAENAEGITYSRTEKFTTPGQPSQPEVVTGAITKITSSQADASGVISGMGNVDEITEHGHVWSTKANPTISDNKTSLGAKWATGSFTSTLTGLKPNVTYHVRAYAVNKMGPAYGEDITFTTDYSDATLVTDDATEVMSKTAKVGGRITDKGGHEITERGVCWSTSATPTVSDNISASSSHNDNFTATLSGLAAETLYYARAYVKTARGDVYYGNAVSFTTPKREVDILIDGCGDEQAW